METTINQVKYYIHEQGQGLPVVFIHGFPFDHTIWDPVISRLEGHVRVIAPDLRGFGRSEAPEGVYTMRLLADDIAGLMDKLGEKQAVIVGHSMGGYVALAFAQAYPERLLGLGLVSTRSGADSEEGRKNRYATAEEVIRTGPKAVADSMAPKLARDTRLQEKLYEIMVRTHPNGLVGALKGMAERPDMSGFLPEITAWTLVVAGTDDQVIPASVSQQMSGAIPRAEWVEIPGAGHVAMMEAPEPVAGSLNRLITEVQTS